MISWSYYGERCWRIYSVEAKFSVYTYKAIFIVAVFMGANISLGAVLDFSDMMISAWHSPMSWDWSYCRPKWRREPSRLQRRYKAGNSKPTNKHLEWLLSNAPKETLKVGGSLESD